ncbi:MAG: hypothetical protein IKS46_06325, partial [Clostridia bacterium]|nr:hypothetical protein [Clostridia bacterium]
IQGYKENDFVITKTETGNLVLTDASGGTITVSDWDATTLQSIQFTSGDYSQTLEKSAIDAQLFNVVTLGNTGDVQLAYSGGADARQQFDIAFSEDTNIVIDSPAGAEDRIKFTNGWSNDHEDLFVNGNDLYLWNWDEELGDDAPGQLIIKDYLDSSVKTMEFSNQTYHLITGNETFTGSDTVRDRYVFLNRNKTGDDLTAPDWNVTLSGLTTEGMAPDVIDLRSLRGASQYYSLNCTKNEQEFVLTYRYSVTPNEEATLGSIHITDFFNEDDTVNSANGYPLVRLNREFYAGNDGNGRIQFDGLTWDRIKGSNGQPEKSYRWLNLNAGTADADEVNLGELVKPAYNSNAQNYGWLYYAGDGDDVITAHEGDIVYGGDGDDTLNAQGRMSDIYGGSGNDTITVRAADGGNLDHVNVYGEQGDDIIEAYGSYHAIFGAGGGDTIRINSAEGDAEPAHDSFISGGSGDDYIYINGGYNHRVNGNKGDDHLFVVSGDNNLLRGRDGNDELVIEGGDNNTLDGGAGNDTFVFANGSGHNTIADYTAEEDTIQIANGSISQAEIVDGTDLKFTLGGGSITVQDGVGKAISVEDGSGSYTVYAGNGTLNGGEGDDRLYGGSGKDTLFGGAGNDKLYGGAGNDTLYGQRGDDELTGGAGNDTFVYYTGYGHETITDYTEGEDTIKLMSGSISRTEV